METGLDREELHFLLDRIPESDIPTARKILHALADPVELALLNAPPDNEPLSVHEQAASDSDQRRRHASMPPVSHEELLHEELLNDIGISVPDLQ